MKIGSLCTGYGGIELGLALAGVDVDLRWVAETDPALAPLHGEVPNLGDITRVRWDEVDDVDLLVAGFPCQPTSNAGARLGDADPRWLWPAVRAAIAELQPPRVLIENVPGLVSWQKGRLWRTVLGDLVDLGYGVRWLIVGACRIGAAHHRHRVFALAEMGGTGAERIELPACGAKGDLLLPTPAASRYGSNQGGAAGRVGPVRYSLDRIDQLLPTPTASLGRATGFPSHETAETRFAQGRRFLDDAVALLPTPRATDGTNGGPSQRGSSGDLAMPSAVQPQHFGRYAAAVERHASIYRPPPAPTEPNRNGAPRLAPEFSEWLMCLPAGHVTAKLVRKDALRAIGNGVCPPQMAAAWRLLAGAA